MFLNFTKCEHFQVEDSPRLKKIRHPLTFNFKLVEPTKLFILTFKKNI